MTRSRPSVLRVVLPVLALAACSPGVLVETSLGAVRVTEDPDLARFSPVTLAGGERIEPFPEFGGLVVTGPEGGALSFEDRALASAALAAFCGGALPPDLSYRGALDDGASTWSSGPCPEAPPGPAAS
ncbi:hypothetical protein [Histidinibacterium lentulum]|uniref:Uncharacterized protein n=1 Tax=Histidinibacterium lentulum TaxID=2480588 RepID=A0A3N2QUR7_9RHOB|nr:hypothetical protein [Histidinibacterium lentulum]ROT98947.1 hypothetical protein EAT49_15050 [Histidinibacterium lentulum]